jgi:DNA-nicking Smr family endonuclease
MAPDRAPDGGADRKRERHAADGAVSTTHKRPRRVRIGPPVQPEVSLTAAMAAVPQVKGEDELSFRRNGISANRLRQLRRGEQPIDETVDLHGLTEAQAHKVLVSFLAAASGRQARCVRIVHGKGLRSGDRGPVLKNVVNAVLRQTSSVLGYVSARATDGGTGATYALLAAGRLRSS